MIQGLQLKVSHTEIKAHCEERSAYHAEKAREKKASLPELRKALEVVTGRQVELPNTVSAMNKGGYHLDPRDAVADLERDIREHQNKSVLFAFLAGHLHPDDYNLTESDLVRLEILARS